MKKFEIITSVAQYNHISELPEDEQKLIIAAREATQNAYAPYSNFKVGAALLLDNGKIVTGSNQENAAYPSGLCAERTAIFWANSNYPNNAILKIAISVNKDNQLIDKAAAPCGSCRQVMLESETRYQTNMKTILDSSEEILVVDKIADLLPLNFTSDNLL